jgi:hypothetical protein
VARVELDLLRGDAGAAALRRRLGTGGLVGSGGLHCKRRGCQTGSPARKKGHRLRTVSDGQLARVDGGGIEGVGLCVGRV